VGKKTVLAVIKASGLNTSPNQLNVPEGSLIEANNVIIARDNVVEPTRGYKLYGSELGDDNFRTKQLFAYRNRLFRHYDDKIEYDSDDAGDFSVLSGDTIESPNDYRIKTSESNGNVYITSADGVKVISAKSGTDLENASITGSHLQKAIDISGTVIYNYGDLSGFLLNNSKVAYRAVWATKDRNENLYEGVPSQRLVIENSLEDTLIKDFNNTLLKIDMAASPTPATTAFISDTNYFTTLALDSSANASDLLDSLNTLTTKLDSDIRIGDYGITAPINLNSTSAKIQVTSGVCTISKTGGTSFLSYLEAGSVITLSGLTSTDQVGFNGRQTLTTVLADSIAFLTDLTAPVALTAVDSGIVITFGGFGNIESPATPNTPAAAVDLTDIRTYFTSIITQLQILNSNIIETSRRNDYIDNIVLTEGLNTRLKITIPEGITTNYFLEIYRSALATATDVTVLDDITPSDELQQVYEVYVSTSDISTGYIIFNDQTPEEFLGANLYTNPSSGEGILGANEAPPACEDINRYKNVIFYANTRTKHRLLITLLGVLNMVDDYNNSITPKLSIVDINEFIDLQFVVGVNQTQTMTFASSAAQDGKYFDLYATNDELIYRLYYAHNTSTIIPSNNNGEILTRIDISSTATDTEVKNKTINVINSLVGDFSAVSTGSNTTTVTNLIEGPATGIDLTGTVVGFSTSITTTGEGEDVANKKVLLSNETSVAKSIDSTSKSLCRVINGNASSPINAFYVSGPDDVPGKILFEARTLEIKPFYVMGNNDTTGASFNQDISPEKIITSINTVTNEIQTSAAHGFTTGDEVVISLTDTTPAINNSFTIEVINSTTFKLTNSLGIVDIVAVVTGTGTVSKTSYAVVSDNEEKSNRIYFSKQMQPESVPLINYFDVGAQESEILRIFPVRDSLFIFKEDGLYRLSGESSPYNVQLYDGNFILTAPDSVAALNNSIYCWTTQGISVVSETGTQPSLSRPIDTEVLKIGSNVNTNFKSLTWGINYESDNSYMVFTTSGLGDTEQGFAYRYNNLTNSWTTLQKSANCGVVHPRKDKLYLGMNDVAYIEEERKSFSREDYAGREYDLTIDANKYNSSTATIIFSDVSNIDVGDVITQDQTLSIYQYNQLLKQLDNDDSLSLSLKAGDTTGYFSALKMLEGNSGRTKVLALATRLDSDTGPSVSDFAASIATASFTINAISIGVDTIVTSSSAHGLIDGRVITITGSNSTPSINGTHVITYLSPTTFKLIGVSVEGVGTSGTGNSNDDDFDDIKVCYNKLITKLNTDPNVQYSTYPSVTNNTLFEGIIISVNRITKAVKLDVNQDYIRGNIVLYKALESSIKYSPITFGDPLSLKMLYDASFLFQDKNFSEVDVSFSTDLLPGSVSVTLEGSGNGIFGKTTFGNEFFGGLAHSAPLRTYIPRDMKRCTFIVVRMTHRAARERYSLYGITMAGMLTGSTRAYR
jgi:hypothetical protein